MKSNKESFPDAWEFFEEHARNIEGTHLEYRGKYRIPKPDRSGGFLYANNPGYLFIKLKEEFYKPSLNSPSVRGKVQGIVETFK